MLRILASVACAGVIAGLVPAQQEASAKSSKGEPALQSVGPIAFAPKTLLVSDRKAATIHAIELDALEGTGLGPDSHFEGIDRKLATLLGTTPDQVQIIDLAVHPESRLVFLAVSRGTGPDAMPVLAMLHGDGEMALFELEGRNRTAVALPNPPVAGSGRRARNRHLESITDLAYVDGKVVVAGLSNEEFASKLRVLGCPTRSSLPSCGCWTSRSTRPRQAPASRSTTVPTASSRRARRCGPSCRT